METFAALGMAAAALACSFRARQDYSEQPVKAPKSFIKK